MISAVFRFSSDDGCCLGFRVEGHAGFGRFGNDLVCCAVSVAIQMCCNGITEVAKKKADVVCGEGMVELKVVDHDEIVQLFLKSLELQLSLIEKNHGKNLKLKRLEV